MKKLALFILILCPVLANSQLGVRYDPAVQKTKYLQYFRPKGNLFVGDCMPFAYNGTYYCYWLLDSAHHASLNGLGGHQWVLSTTTDLINWKQYPVVLGLDEAWEKSICTGSIVHYKDKFYAFYATRLINEEGKVNEQLSYAVSADGIHFEKQKPNPFYTSAPGYSKRDFRDPKVFVDEKTGEFHLFVSSREENPVLAHQAGALVHLSSTDLKNWKVLPPVLTGQPSVPECPDFFNWNGWYYLVYSDNSDTYYVKSRNPYGPWEQPRTQALVESWSNVVKTAAFKGNRRIAGAWVPSRRDNKDSNGETFGGNLIFREVVQLADGTLETKFPPEMIPPTGSPLALDIRPDLYATLEHPADLLINAPNGVGAAHLDKIPLKCRITMEIEPMGPSEEWGFYLRADEKADKGYKVDFSAGNQTVQLGNTRIQAVSGLDKPIKLDLVLNDDIIDLCIDNRRCIVNRTVEQKGQFLWFFAKHGKVRFKSIKIAPLTEE
ncbi:MAG: family 43 glycosylhydrolase [Williamsia sp.]|nr:family 43 glycosylhydrolase [Williamsia sp.]